MKLPHVITEPGAVMETFLATCGRLVEHSAGKRLEYCMLLASDTANNIQFVQDIFDLFNEKCLFCDVKKSIHDSISISVEHLIGCAKKVIKLSICRIGL